MKIRPLTISLFLLLACAMGIAQNEIYILIPGTFDPGHTGTAVGLWVKHLGNQDPGETDTDNFGLLFSKNTATSTLSAATATIRYTAASGNLNIKPLFELGYDIRLGGHCGAGSPRFNVLTSDSVTHFIGCSSGTPTAGAPAGWQRYRWDPSNGSQAFPPVAPTDLVLKISMVADEGTDTAPDFSGFSILDDIDINGELTGEPKS